MNAHRLHRSRNTALALAALTVGLVTTSSFAVDPFSDEYRNRGVFGTNPSGIAWWASAYPFADAFKTSLPWHDTEDLGKTYSLQTDSLGYPVPQADKTPTTRVLNQYYPAGTYVLTYEGDGSVSVRGSSGSSGFAITSRQANRLVLDLDPSQCGSIIITITVNSTTDPLRDFHLWMPGFENASQPFHPRFIELCRPFGVLRFMDFMQTNGSTVERWDDRPRVEHSTFMSVGGMQGSSYNGVGVPLEWLIELANAASTNPWFCMPHAADDDYVRRFAALVKQQLDPSLDIYVEYSNEVHNGSFAVYDYAAAKGLELGLATDAKTARHRFQALRSTQMFALWRDVFGADSGRVKRVMAVGNGSDAGLSITYEDTRTQIDAVAMHTYFGIGVGGDLASPIRQYTPDDILDTLEQEIDGSYRTKITYLDGRTDLLGVPLICYEGGQHLSTYADDLSHLSAQDLQDFRELMWQCNRHPRMADIYRKALDVWFEEGGSLYCTFSHVTQCGNVGCWGLFEHMTQPLEQAPKAQAIIDYLDNPSVPLGTATTKPSHVPGLRSDRTLGLCRSAEGVRVIPAHDGHFRCTITDASGRVRLRREGNGQPAIVIAREELPHGLYFVELTQREHRSFAPVLWHR